MNISEKVNLGRQSEFDWIKSFSVLFMIIIHVYEVLSNVSYRTMPNDFFRLSIEFTT